MAYINGNEILFSANIGLDTNSGGTGVLRVTENGAYDVRDKAMAVVDVKPKLQEKIATANGVISPDEGYDGLGLVVVSVAGEVVEEWDGSYTVSGGTISFTIDGDHYEAVEGMTWAEWVNSSYNTGGFTCSGDSAKVYTANGRYWVHSDADVYGSYTIVADKAYELRSDSGSSN